MKLDDEYVDAHSQRGFEYLFSVITGIVGLFFLVVSVWFAKSIIQGHRFHSGPIMFWFFISLISYWFLKLSYKLLSHNTKYLLSNAELRAAGWFFIIIVPLLIAVGKINGQSLNLEALKLLVPCIIAGHYALKVVKKRKYLSQQTD